VPTVGVLLNVYTCDDPIQLRHSLRSIVSQSRLPDEVVVVADGSLSDSLDHALRDELRTLPHTVIGTGTRRRGLAHARNVGLRCSSSDFIALQDADDRMHPDRLRVGMEELVRSDADIFASAVVEFDANSDQVQGGRVTPADLTLRSRAWFWNNPIAHSSVIVRRSTVVNAGGYLPHLYVEDYHLWLRLTRSGAKWATSPLVLQALAIDTNHFRRRGGLRYIRSEMSIHEEIKALGGTGVVQRWIRLIARIAIRLSPSVLRRVIVRILPGTKRVRGSIAVSDFLESPPRLLAAGGHETSSCTAPENRKPQAE
jgi:glycosyltransferase involved in cell wall biosynthesis